MIKTSVHWGRSSLGAMVSTRTPRGQCSLCLQATDIGRSALQAQQIILLQSVIALLNDSQAHDILGSVIHPNHFTIYNSSTTVRQQTLKSLAEQFQRLLQAAPINNSTLPPVPQVPVPTPAPDVPTAASPPRRSFPPTPRRPRPSTAPLLWNAAFPLQHFLPPIPRRPKPSTAPPLRNSTLPPQHSSPPIPQSSRPSTAPTQAKLALRPRHVPTHVTQKPGPKPPRTRANLRLPPQHVRKPVPQEPVVKPPRRQAKLSLPPRHVHKPPPQKPVLMPPPSQANLGLPPRHVQTSVPQKPMPTSAPKQANSGLPSQHIQKPVPTPLPMQANLALPSTQANLAPPPMQANLVPPSTQANLAPPSMQADLALPPRHVSRLVQQRSVSAPPSTISLLKNTRTPEEVNAGYKCFGQMELESPETYGMFYRCKSCNWRIEVLKPHQLQTTYLTTSDKKMLSWYCFWQKFHAMAGTLYRFQCFICKEEFDKTSDDWNCKAMIDHLRTVHTWHEICGSKSYQNRALCGPRNT